MIYIYIFLFRIFSRRYNISELRRRFLFFFLFRLDFMMKSKQDFTNISANQQRCKATEKTSYTKDSYIIFIFRFDFYVKVRTGLHEYISAGRLRSMVSYHLLYDPSVQTWQNITIMNCPFEMRSTKGWL